MVPFVVSSILESVKQSNCYHYAFSGQQGRYYTHSCFSNALLVPIHFRWPEMVSSVHSEVQ